MSKWRNLVFALLCAALLLAPVLAEARAGGSAGPGGSMGYSSQGSMGSRSYGSNGAQPLNRSMAPQPGYGGGYYGGSFGQNHPFLTGLAGGFLGSWIGSMLFPHWGYGYGGYGYGGVGILGTLFSWLLIIGFVWMIFRLFRGRAWAGGGGGMVYEQPVAYYGGGYGGYGAPQSAPLAIGQTDYSAFEAILKAVQGAWSNADLRTLGHYVTPEMLSYFSEELAGNTSRGVANHVDQVELIQGDVREAWDEGNLQYATVFLQWRAADYTVRLDREQGQPDWLVEGDPQRQEPAQEAWTFARSPGGHWLLSAIQQV
jgi:hypothetical protein